VIAVMTVKKTTEGKVVYIERDDSTHFDTIGIRLSIYVPKITAKNMLDNADLVTLMIEAGDQTKAAV
jgi:hypothetical protein